MMTRVCLGKYVYFSGYQNLLWVNPGRQLSTTQPLTPCQQDEVRIGRVKVQKLVG